MAKSSPSLVGILSAAVWLLLAALTITGIALSTRYSSSVESAHASVTAIRESKVFGAIHNFHYLGSGLLILLSGTNVFILLWTARFSLQDRWLWWTGVGVAAIAIVAQMSGNLLPFSQHDVRTVYIEANIGSQMPLVGDSIRSLVLVGDNVSQSTLDRWYLVHRFVFPVLLLILALPAIRAIRFEAKAKPAWIVAITTLLFLIAASALLQTPLGPAAELHDFASGSTKPMWYVLPMHATLNTMTALSPALGWIGSILIPKVVLLFFIALPFIFRNPASASIKVTGKIVSVLLVVGFALAMFNYGDKVQKPLEDEPVFTAPKPVNNLSNTPIDDSLTKLGKQLFQKNNCVACHSIGDQKGGTLGPNLSGVGAKYADAAYFIELLKSPQSKGIATMPAFDTLPEHDLRALAEYLRSLK